MKKRAALKPPKPTEAKFKVVLGDYGYRVTPATHELWFLGDAPRVSIAIVNKTSAQLAVEIADDGVIQHSEGVFATNIDGNATGTLEIKGRPRTAHFDLLIWCSPCEGVTFRARANSDPRIVVRPSPA